MQYYEKLFKIIDSNLVLVWLKCTTIFENKNLNLVFYVICWEID